MRFASTTIGFDLTPLRRGGANGGVKPLILRCLNALGHLFAGRAQFVFFTNSESHDELRLFARYGDRIVCVWEVPGFSPPKASMLWHRELLGDDSDPLLLINQGVDVLYCPFGATPLACPGIPTVSCIVDLLHRDFPASISRDELAHRERYLTETMQVSDSLNCISQYVVDRVRTLYPAYDGQLFYTYNTIQERFSEVASAAVPDLPVGPFFYYPANFWVHKNHEALLIAYQIYRARAGAAAWSLVLTGHEDARAAEIKALAASLGVAEAVHFLGHVDEGQLKTIWQRCGALVFPSLHEGFGIPLLEAMHFSKPIIASQACCLPEIAGDAALLIDPRKPEDLAHALASVAASPEQQESLAQRGAQRLRQFDFEAEMRKLADVILSVRTRRCWQRGVYADGWMGSLALIALPRLEGRWRLIVDLAGKPSPTLFSLHAGARPLGTHRVEANETRQLAFWLRNPHGTLRLGVDSASAFAPGDARALGLRLVRIDLASDTGQTVTLYSP